MNKLIKELALEAGMSECTLGYGMPENVLWGENQIGKFAELIIEKFAYELMDLHGSSPEHIIYAAKRYGVQL